MEASIMLKNVVKLKNEKNFLVNLSFGVEKGSKFAIIGKNGSGKTTLLKMISGIKIRDKGNIYINGKETVAKDSETRFFCGFMPQKNNLDPQLTIKQNLILHANLYGINNQEALQKTLYWMDKINFTNSINCFPKSLSIGEQRKILFVRSIIHNPQVLLMDEPTEGLDPENYELLWSILNSLDREITILFTTQNLDEAERFSNRIAILNNGSIDMDGSLEKLLETSFGLFKYRLKFNNKPNQDFIKEIKNYPRIIKPVMDGLELTFYARERKDFFSLLKVAFNYNLNDFSTKKYGLKDLYFGISRNENNV